MAKAILWSICEINAGSDASYERLSSTGTSLAFLSVIFHQVYAPGPYGEYVAPPPYATQIVYSADGQPYTVAYPHQYHGKYFSIYHRIECKMAFGDMKLDVLSISSSTDALVKSLDLT